MTDVRHIPFFDTSQPDRWLMQTVFEHSSSGPARAAAAAWLAAYDIARADGMGPPQAHVHADSALNAATTPTGLPTADGRQP